MTDELNAKEGLTRREALKKGARFGGALVWAVPVVQTVGMSPALAQRVSEGNCCLRIAFESPSFVGFDGSNAVYQFNALQSNCGDLEIFNATLFIEYKIGDGAWGLVQDFNQGPIPVGTSDNPIDFATDFGPGAKAGQTVRFRAHGEFDCVADSDDLWHTIPGGGPNTYIEYGPFVVPDP